MRVIKNISIFLLIAFLVFGCKNKPLDPSIPPKGFLNNTTLKIAYTTGRLKLIENDFPLPEDIREYKDVVYKAVDTTNLKLDIYHSKDIKEDAPLIIFVHGGAWKKGNKHDYWKYLIDYAQKGYITATVQYRFVGVAKYPAQLDDLNDAIKWLKYNATDYHIDNTRVALVGGSAGGHLVMMSAYTNSLNDLDKNGIPTNVQAVVNFYGPSDLVIDTARDKKAVQNLFGKTFGEAPELYKSASPLYFVSKDAPPTLTFHGTLDELVPYQQSDQLHASLQKAGATSYYHLLEGWPHTMDASVKVNAYAQYHMDAFFKKYLLQE